MLDVRRLRVLLAVAEHGGIAAAARALSFTPPAVSQQIAALERQLDVPLVDRSQRNVRLTDAGQRLAGHARLVLAGLEAAEVDMGNPEGTVRGLLRVAAIPTLGQALLPSAVARMRASAPDVELRIDQAEPEDSLPALARGAYDLALAGEYGLAPRRLDTSVERLDLLAEPVLIAVPLDHPAAGPEVHLADLRDARWIAPAPGSSCAVLLERSCAVAGYEPDVVGHVADFAMAAALVGAGHGVALIPTSVSPAAPEERGIRLLRSTEPEIHRTLYAAVRAGTRQHPAIGCLLDALAEAAADLTHSS
jgi:DNA-binding transcriptional LysR family regulator